MKNLIVPIIAIGLFQNIVNAQKLQNLDILQTIMKKQSLTPQNGKPIIILLTGIPSLPIPGWL